MSDETTTIDGEYFCADGQWRPCRIGNADQYGNIYIEANGQGHRVPRLNVRPSTAPDSSVPTTAPAAATEKKDKWVTSNGAVVWIWGRGISISPVSDRSDERTVILSRQEAIEIIERLREAHNLDELGSETPRPMEQQRTETGGAPDRISRMRKALEMVYEEHLQFGWGYEECHDAVIEALGGQQFINDYNRLHALEEPLISSPATPPTDAGETKTTSPAPATATEEKERVIQEIKDLFALYGSGGYTPEEWEKNIIDEGLRTLLSPQPSTTDEQIALNKAEAFRNKTGLELTALDFDCLLHCFLSAIQEAKRQA